MLNQLLTVMSEKKGPISLDGLSEELGMEKSALKGMLDLLVWKGIVRHSDLGQTPEDGSCSSVACMSCGKAGQCPFAGKMPRFYEKVGERDKRVPSAR